MSVFFSDRYRDCVGVPVFLRASLSSPAAPPNSSASLPSRSASAPDQLSEPHTHTRSHDTNADKALSVRRVAAEIPHLRVRPLPVGPGRVIFVSQQRLELGHVRVQPGNLTREQKHGITHTHAETALSETSYRRGLPVPPASSLLPCDWLVPSGALL